MLSGLLVFWLVSVSVAAQECPLCEEVDCVEELTQYDCPDGHHLVDDVIFGCCPACVKYLDYSQPCPGVLWLDDDENFTDDSIVYGEKVAGDDDKHWPDSLVGETQDLPCRQVTPSNFYTDTSVETLTERVSSVQWRKSRDESKMVPVLEVPACRPDLICQKLQYDECGSGECQKYPPGRSPVTDEDPPGPRSDPFPICNALPERRESEAMDCSARPCTCHHMDYTLWSSHQWGEDCSTQLWAPQCSPTGLYSPVQHKLNPWQDNSPVRWCSSPTGVRIFGGEKVSPDQSLMTCGCSRKRWELEQRRGEREARRDVTLHCGEDGGWDPLQCDQEMCWCVSTESGKAVSVVVPDTLISLLPCYPAQERNTVFGNQYLRKCEYRHVMVARSQALLSRHGSQWNVATQYDCDYDGSFAPVQCVEGECHCYYNTGAQLGTYGIDLTNRGDMKCGCARDKEKDLNDHLLCDGVGDYKALQQRGEQEFCVDPEDGWRLSGMVTKQAGGCCLDSDYYREVRSKLTDCLPAICQGKLEGRYYNTGAYVFWDSTRQRSFQCRPHEVDPDRPGDECIDCREDIMRCQ